MDINRDRRDFLKGLGVAGTVLALGPGTATSKPADDRFIIEASQVRREDLRSELEVVHDLSEEIGYYVARGPEWAIPGSANYARDLVVEYDVPNELGEIDPEGDQPETDQDAGVPSFFQRFQWDKFDQGLPGVHDFATGDGARVGIMDTGVLGADPDDPFRRHPDLEANVNEELSAAFVPTPQEGGDSFGPGPVDDDHGTHVGGIAAATERANVLGHAPDAEVVDLRVFSGTTATFGDIIAAHVYGAQPVSEGGAGCDVLNLSLGTTAPLLPVEDPDEIDDETLEQLDPIVPVSESDLAQLEAAVTKAGNFALANGTIPVAAAGNNGVNLDREPEGFDVTPEALPATADPFLSVSATGPVGFSWDPETDIPPSVGGPAVSLGTREPSAFTNYGPDSVDVSAPGGNFDARAQLLDDEGLLAEDVFWFADLVFNSTFINEPRRLPLSPRSDKRAARIGRHDISLGWKAGTSMAAPQVAGLIALLRDIDPNAAPTEIIDHVLSTADDEEVGIENPDGDGFVTTAPDRLADEDDVFGTVRVTDQRPDSESYRGAGHIDTFEAVSSFATNLRLTYDTHFHGDLGDPDGELNVANYFGLADELLEDAPGHGMMLGGGDDLHMSVMSSVFSGQHMVDVLNASPMDYNTFGNHEFDTGPEDCRAAVANSEFDWLSANVLDEETGEAFAADEGAARYAIEEIDGVRIALTGLAPEDAPEVTSIGEDTEVRAPVTAAQEVLDDLEDEDADLVILLSHLASPVAESLVEEVDGFDVVVADHAAFVEEDVLEVNDTLLSFVGDELDFLGQLDLEIRNGEIVNHGFELHDVAELAEQGQITPNEEIATIHADYASRLDDQLGNVIGETTVDIDVREEIVRREESGFGNYVADVVRESTNADVAIQNGGGIRSDQIYEAGDITRRMIVDILPFPNDTGAVELSGAELRSAIEHGVSTVEDRHGRFPQVSGMSYSYDPNAPPGDRVEEVTVGGTPLDESATYTVGTNDFLMIGGDGYDMIAEADVVVPPEEGQRLSAAVILAIEEAGVISPETEGRIELLDGDTEASSLSLVPQL